MSKNTHHIEDPFGGGEPKWPTATRRLTRDGRLVGATPGAGVWLYKKVPLSAMVDAKTTADRLASGIPLLSALNVINDLTRVGGVLRRSLVKSNYRHVHGLMLDVPQFFQPPHDHYNAPSLTEDHGHQLIETKTLLFGVRLRDSIVGAGGWRGALDSVMETLTTGGTPLSDFDRDFAQVDRALTQAGLAAVSQADIRFADSFFNRGISPDPIMRPDMDNLVVFSSPETARYAKEHWNDLPLRDWPDDPGYHVLSMASVQDIDLEWVAADTSKAMWATQLLRSNAAVISVRGILEPAAVTRREVEAKQNGVANDIRERYKANKITKAEQEQRLGELQAIHAMYGSDGAPPTLVDTSIVVGFSGLVEDVEDVLGPGSPVTLNPMSNRQLAALAETWLCSNVRANPHLLDLPATTLGFSGLTEQSKVGDRPTPWSVLTGFTERDRQPAWFDPRAAYGSEQVPMYGIFGASGSGKSLLGTYFAAQFAESGVTPCVFIDPKVGQDLSPAFRQFGAQCVSLDDLVSADGIFDPLRWSIGAKEAIGQAANMLLSVNPWGSRSADFEVPITAALAYGVSQGATCIGQALTIAREHDQVEDPMMVERVLTLAKTDQLFGSMCGLDPTSTALRLADGATYIRVGNANLILPEPGAAAMNLQQRISINLVRMMVIGSATAMINRSGVVMLDEAWVFFDGGNTELERISRVIRSQNVTVMLFTQRVSDATVTGIDEHISGGWILPLKEGEAKAACRILGLEPTPERLARITARATVGTSSDTDGGASPNWNSMRALHRPGTREVLRGSVALYADLDGRVVPTEIVVPPRLLARASTNRADMQARDAMDAATA